MAHPPPPPGPPPGIGEGEEAFRLAVYHISRRSVRREDGSYVYVRQYIYKSEWYRSELEPCILQWEIKTFFAATWYVGIHIIFHLLADPETFRGSRGDREKSRGLPRGRESSTRLAMGNRGEGSPQGQLIAYRPARIGIPYWLALAFLNAQSTAYVRA